MRLFNVRRSGREGRDVRDEENGVNLVLGLPMTAFLTVNDITLFTLRTNFAPTFRPHFAFHSPLQLLILAQPGRWNIVGNGRTLGRRGRRQIPVPMGTPLGKTWGSQGKRSCEHPCLRSVISRFYF